jgi:hypothetical protein
MKWTKLIRDTGFRKIALFNRLLESIPVLTPRVLSMRLKEQRGSPMMVWYCGGSLRRVKNMMPVLMQLVAFASKWYSIVVVFDAERPRKLRLVLSFLY